jgi:hypothetical protein
MNHHTSSNLRNSVQGIITLCSHSRDAHTMEKDKPVNNFTRLHVCMYVYLMYTQEIHSLNSLSTFQELKPYLSNATQQTHQSDRRKGQRK